MRMEFGGRRWRWHLRQGLRLIVILCLAPVVAAMEFSDPTRPLSGVVFKKGGGVLPEDRAIPVLGSVLIGLDRRVAIIDGKRYQENDLVGDYQLVSIAENRVTLVKGIETLELQMASVRVKDGHRDKEPYR